MPRGWRRLPLPLLSGGEQSAAAPGGYEPEEVQVLRNALITGKGTVAQQGDWLLADTLQDADSEEMGGCLGVFPFEQQGGASAASQGVAFGWDKLANKIRLHQLLEDLTIDRSLVAYSSYTEALPPQITGFEMFGKFYFCEYARETTTLRKGMAVFDPAGGGSVSIPTFVFNAGSATALKFRGIAKHRGATILGWGYWRETDVDGPHVMRYCKYGAPDTWVPDTSETTGGFFNIGTLEVPVVACAASGRYTIIGKVGEIFALDGDYSSQFYADQIGDAHGPISTAGMTSIGDAAVWMSAEGPAISEQGSPVQLLGIDRITRRFLRYMDLLNASAAHDSRNNRVLWALRRKYDGDGNAVEDLYLSELLVWDYAGHRFYVSHLPSQIWALGTSRGPGLQLVGPSGVVSNITASEVTSNSALIAWVPGDVAPDVSFHIQYRENGTSTWFPGTPIETAQATYQYRLLTLDPATKYDVQIRQVRNGQVSEYVQSLDLFTTGASGTVGTPTGVTVEEREKAGEYIKGQWYGSATVKWNPYHAGRDVVMRIYVSRDIGQGPIDDFAQAGLSGEEDPAAGEHDSHRRFVSGKSSYWWARMENDVTDTQSSEVQATPAPITIYGVLA